MDISSKAAKQRILNIYEKSRYYRYRNEHGKISKRKLFELYKEHVIYLFLAVIGFLILFPIVTYIIFAQDINNKDRLLNRNNTGLTLLDRNNKPFFTFNRPKAIRYISINDIPIELQHGVVSAENRTFYTDPGFSLRGIGRAIVVDLSGRKLSQGGSTITQELVKTALLNSSRNFLRKYEEIVLAVEIERRYSKNDILELYLNSVYFGEGAFGAENASQVYFGKDAKNLDLAQAALLVGLLPAPSAYDPLVNNPQIAIDKQHIVLNEMVQSGYITQEEADAAKKEKIIYTHPQKTNDLNTLAPHFALYVKNLLDNKFGADNIIRQGFRVKTTLNSDWQAYAETVVQNQVSYLKYNSASNGAAVVLDPKTGEILVMVGSHDWNDSGNGKTNLALHPRQPGSSFKPIIYGDAIEEKKITAATILHDDPITYPDGYKPHDYDNRFRGPVTVRRALSNSLNVPAVEVMQKIGISDGLRFAKQLGITTLGTDPTRYGLSLVLGAGEVPLLEMTNAFATYADKGMYNPPSPILEIDDKYSTVVEKYTPNPIQAVSDNTAFIVSSILSDNITRAEEFGNLLTISRPAAVKTGTTSDFKDALTIGYTPSITVGVWVGNNDNTSMDNVAGSLGAAPIWRQLMEHFLAGTPVEKFDKPFGVVSEVACPYRGTSNTKFATGSAQLEFFIDGTQPSKTDCISPTGKPAPTNGIAVTPTKTPDATPTNTPAPTEKPTTTPVPTAVQIPTTTPVITPTSATITQIPNPTL